MTEPVSDDAPAYVRPGRHALNAREKARIKDEEEARKIAALEEIVQRGDMPLQEAKGLLELAARSPDTTVPAVMALSKLNGWQEESDSSLDRLRSKLMVRRDASKAAPEPLPMAAQAYEVELSQLTDNPNFVKSIFNAETSVPEGNPAIPHPPSMPSGTSI